MSNKKHLNLQVVCNWIITTTNFAVNTAYTVAELYDKFKKDKDPSVAELMNSRAFSYHLNTCVNIIRSNTNENNRTFKLNPNSNRHTRKFIFLVESKNDVDPKDLISSKQRMNKPLTRIVKNVFMNVAKNKDLQDKWISCDGWLELMKFTKIGDQLISKLDVSLFRRIINKEYNVNCTLNTNHVNRHGVYFMQRNINKRKRGEIKAQSNVSCFLITNSGCIPSTHEALWYYCITAIDSPPLLQASTQATTQATTQASTQASTPATTRSTTQATTRATTRATT